MNLRNSKEVCVGKFGGRKGKGGMMQLHYNLKK